MQGIKRTASRLALLAATISLGVGAVAPNVAVANAGSPHDNGIVCTDGALSGTERTFDLSTKDGYVALPDGTTAYMWGYSAGDGAFQHPSPVLCANEGETVAVVLHNTFSYDDVSIVFPGQTDVLADGVPVQPQFDGTTLTSFAQVATTGGGRVTYTFVADHPGTFLYESGTDPHVQVKLGLFGVLIVRPALGAEYAYNATDTRFNPDSEYLALLSEIDPNLSSWAARRKTRLDRGRPAGAAFNMANYKPRYWLINGRGFPDSIADNGASWLPAQPYGALAEILPEDATNPYPSMTRYASVGSADYPFHPHGNNGRVVGRDGRPMRTASDADVSYDKFSVPVGPGQTWDLLFSWKDAEGYDAVANPVPVTEPNLQNMVLGMFYSGTPYLGSNGPLPPGESSMNECGEFYIISHNHALYQLSSFGVNMTGPVTYTRVNPPIPNSCG